MFAGNFSSTYTYPRIFQGTSSGINKTDYSNRNYSKSMDEQLAAVCTNAKNKGIIVMTIALDLVSGSDVWLNTPQRPLEASGTSGMKASLNGVPHLSVLDGWWVEGCIEGITGWAIGGDGETENGGDAEHLYQKLGDVVLPLWYGDRASWVAVMKGAIGKNASFFNSHRMLRHYAIEAYLR